MIPSPDELLVGRLALHYKLITQSQLEEVTSLLALAGGRRQLTEILTEMGYLTPRQVEQLLIVQRDFLAKRQAQSQAPAEAPTQTQAPASEQAPAETQGQARALAQPQAQAPARMQPPAPAADSRAPSALGPAIGPGSGAPLPALAPAAGATLPPLPPAAPLGPVASSPSAASAAPIAPPSPSGGAPVSAATAPAAPITPGPPASGGTPAAAERGDPSSTEAARQLDLLLGRAVDQGASDIHLHSAVPISFRVNGRLVDVDPAPLGAAAARQMIEAVLTAEQRQALADRGQVDFAYDLPGRGRFRASAFRQQRGVDAVFRAIPAAPPTLGELGLPESIGRLTDFHQGIVLVTGPAGCGKSSTLAAMVRILNETRREHIITIEDPIEFIHPSRRCLVNQRQVGRHTGSFARALRASLREDPDIIAIGELRDLETISLAITAAETGHLVLATLHTNNAIRTINRILGVFPPNLQDQVRTMLAESLRAVVSQRLVARADGAGRVPALEVLIATRAVSNLIRENKTFQIRSVLQTGTAHGMVQLDVSLADLVRRGVVTREEALLHAEDPLKIPA
jgi:twitching motility protein PilT